MASFRALQNRPRLRGFATVMTPQSSTLAEISSKNSALTQSSTPEAPLAAMFSASCSPYSSGRGALMMPRSKSVSISRRRASPAVAAVATCSKAAAARTWAK